MADKNVSVSGGIGLPGALFLVFLVLKLTGVIAWPWIWVLAPLWIPLVLAAAAAVLFGTIVFILDWLDKR